MRGFVIRSFLSLRPEWIAIGERRYQMGVRFLCPGHLYANHFCELWFRSPADGFDPLPMSQIAGREGTPVAWFRQEGDLEHFTALPMALDEGHIIIPGHWRGHLIGGEVITLPWRDHQNLSIVADDGQEKG